MQVFEELVNANQNEHVLWTLWTDKAKDYIQPSIHFQERCTVNIVIEDYFQQNKVREYTMSTLRVYRLERVLYTIFLVSTATWFIIIPTVDVHNMIFCQC
jgi:hypothetical protein